MKKTFKGLPRITDPRVIARFEKHFEKTDGCWLWTASLAAGYGQFGLHRGKPVGAHRVAYAIYKGEQPPDSVVRHSCDVKPCVNPDHLLLGTPRQNTQDMLERGRGLVDIDRATVVAIYADWQQNCYSAKELAEKYGVARGAVTSIATRQMNYCREGKLLWKVA